MNADPFVVALECTFAVVYQDLVATIRHVRLLYD